VFNPLIMCKVEIEHSFTGLKFEPLLQFTVSELLVQYSSGYYLNIAA